MQKSHYVQSLHDLHKEIAKTEFREPLHSEKAKVISFNIQEIVEHPGNAPFEKHYQLMSNLRDAVTLFEATHPTLTGMINTVIKTLNNIGI